MRTLKSAFGNAAVPLTVPNRRFCRIFARRAAPCVRSYFGGFAASFSWKNFKKMPEFPPIKSADAGRQSLESRTASEITLTGGTRHALIGTRDAVEWEQLATDRAFLAAAVEGSDDAVIGKSLHTGYITLWNFGAERLYGWTAEEIIGKHFSVLVPDDKRAEWDINQDYLAAVAAPSVVMETVRLHKNGTRIDVSVRVGVVRDPQTGEPLGLCSVARDTTTRTASETNHLQSQMQDRKIALALQRPMLFQPKEDAFSGVSVHTAYAMASEDALVGGDFWDTFAFNNEHVALVLGDVMGHGLTSAIFTAEMKFTMRAYIREHIEPAIILYHMNEYLCQSNRLFREGNNTEGSDAPVCLSIAVVIRETGEGFLSVSGMDSPLILRANGETETVKAMGLPLGILENETYLSVKFQLDAGDTLFLSTDGITEARHDKTFLDSKGLQRLVAATVGRTLKETTDSILKGAQDFAGGHLKDDASLVLIRRNQPTPAAT
jgi:PAS domain S-box-containing protein